jgi:DNA topoisomerase VI subunit A
MEEDDEYKYFEDLNCSQARYISKEEILTRIEMHVLNAMIIGKEHSFDLIERNSSNRQDSSSTLFRLGKKSKKRKFNQQNTVRSYSQSTLNFLNFEPAWKTLQMIYKVVQKDKRITQRDLYYNLVTEFKSQNELNEIIQGFKKN